MALFAISTQVIRCARFLAHIPSFSTHFPETLLLPLPRSPPIPHLLTLGPAPFQRACVPLQCDTFRANCTLPK